MSGEAAEHPVERLRRLQAEIASTPGWAVLQRIRRLQRSLAIFLLNSADARGALEFFGDPALSLPLWSVDARDKFDRFLGDIDRLLHNFVAAAKTLVEHSRRIMHEAYEGSDVMRAYGAEVQRLFGEGAPMFIQDLRNYFMHYDLATTIGEMHYSDSEMTSKVLLDRESLLGWNAWKPVTKEWLRSQPEKFDLLEIISDYDRRVRELYDWVNRSLREQHADEVAAVEVMMRDHDELADELRQKFLG